MKIAFHALSVLRAAAGRADRGAHDQRDLDRAARHVPELGGVVDDLVHGQEEEVAVLDVDDRPHAHDGRADGRAEEAELGDRRVEHPVGKLLLPDPSVTVNAPPHPPGTPMSSPRQKTAGSRRISSAIAFAQRFGDAELFHHVASPLWAPRPPRCRFESCPTAAPWARWLTTPRADRPSL